MYIIRESIRGKTKEKMKGTIAYTEMNAKVYRNTFTQLF